jgi:Fibronectin type III domain
MPPKDNPRSEHHGHHPPESTPPSEMDRVLDTLDKVFARFGDRLQTETERPFTGNAQIAVGVFNDIVAGLKFESRPQSITILARRTSLTEVDLTWTDLASNADGYRVERCQGYGCQDLEEIARLPPTARAFQDTNLTEHTPYRYRVVAFNARGEAPSNVVDVTTGTPRG